MPSFSYKGRDSQGGLQQGVLDAPDSEAVANLLMSRGVMPVQIQLVQQRVLSEVLGGKGKKISDEEIMFFSRQMHTLMKAGVPILQALSGLRDSATNPRFAQLLDKLRDSLDSGRELSVAMADTEVFNPFYLSMVRIGEMTGQMDVIFLRLFEYIHFEREMRAKIKAALRYPMFVLFALAAAMAIINLFVIPSFSGVFRSLNAELPLMTRILIEVSDFTRLYWYLCVLAVVLIILGIRYALKTPAGRLYWDKHKLRLPIVGETIRKATLARFARSFSLALASGLPVLQIFGVVGQVVDNTHIAGKLEEMRRGVERGESILRAAAGSKIFTPIVLQMIAVGEESGSIDDLLMEIAQMYEREVDYEVDNLSARIEPLLICCMAVLVLILALGVFLPIWDLGSAMLRR